MSGSIPRPHHTISFLGQDQVGSSRRKPFFGVPDRLPRLLEFLRIPRLPIVSYCSLLEFSGIVGSLVFPLWNTRASSHGHSEAAHGEVALAGLLPKGLGILPPSIFEIPVLEPYFGLPWDRQGSIIPFLRCLEMSRKPIECDWHR